LWNALSRLLSRETDPTYHPFEDEDDDEYEDESPSQLS
jgi:hypothetical protein